MQAKGSAEDLGKGLPDPSDAADKAKGLASDAKSTVKEEANVAGDVSEIPNPFDGAGGIADQVHMVSLCSFKLEQGTSGIFPPYTKHPLQGQNLRYHNDASHQALQCVGRGLG